MRLGAYTIEHQLGAGGMSQVWLARDSAGRRVVLKRQLNDADDERLRDEGRIGLLVKHIGIVQTYELFEHDGRPILALEYVPGPSLAALRKRAPLPPAAVACIGADVAAGLAALHTAVGASGESSPVLHRDVSPANIIVSPDGRGRLIDLGIARSSESATERTQAGDLRGTIRYLAPELFDGKPHSVKSDLWALGVCLFETALGRAAATGPEAAILAAVVRWTLLKKAPGEHIAAPLEEAIAKLCAPEADRVADAAQAAVLLKMAERMCGDGRSETAAAVLATAKPASPAPIELAPAQRGPASDVGDDPFVRFARSTYLHTDEEDLFAVESTAATVLTIPKHTPASDPDAAPEQAETATWDPPQPLPPLPPLPPLAPLGAAAAPQMSPPPPMSLQLPPSSSPGATPAGDESWMLPPKSDGSGPPMHTGSIVIGEVSTDTTEPMPIVPPEEAAAANAEADALIDELRQQTRLPLLPIALMAGVLLVLAVAFLLLR